MSLVVDRAPMPGDDAAAGTAGPDVASRLATDRARFVVHALGLLLLLLALVPVIGTDAQFSADEGAALATAQARSEAGTWAIPHPLPAFGAPGEAFPLEKSQPVDGGFVPLPKRPAYTAVLAALHRVGGVVATVVLSVIATWAAAVLAARLARRIRPTAALPTLWLAGLASPLLFDGYLVMAHALGAALAAGALLAAARSLDRLKALPLVWIATCLAALTLVRSEGVLFALALAGGLGLYGLVRRAGPAVAAGVVAAAAGGGGELANLALERAMFGTSQAHSVRGETNGFLVDRWDALRNSWLRSTYGGVDLQAQFVVLVLVLGLAGVALARRRRPDAGLLTMVGALTAVAAVAAVVVERPGLVPGLLMAFPVGVWGLALLTRQSFRTPVAAVVGLTAAAFTVAILATEYPFGGGAEWGGRYFAIGLPAFVPLAVEGFAAAAARLGRRAARPLGICLGVVAAAATITMVASIRDVHGDHTALLDRIAAAQAAAGPAADGEPPVVLATAAALPRLAWDQLDAGRWLLVDGDGLGPALDRLAALGVTEVVLVSGTGERDAEPVARSPFAPVDTFAGAEGVKAPWVAVLVLAPPVG